MIVASEGKLFAPLKKTSIPVDMGLTGWVIREKKTPGTPGDEAQEP